MNSETLPHALGSGHSALIDSPQQVGTFTEEYIEGLNGASAELLTHSAITSPKPNENDEALQNTGGSDFINEAMLVSRLRALALHFMGCDVSQIARTVGYSRASVVRWLDMWESKNLHGLLCVPRRYITPEAGKALLSAYRAGSWKTSEEGSQWLSKNTGIHVSHVTVWRFAKIRGISFRRPRGTQSRAKFKLAKQIKVTTDSALPHSANQSLNEASLATPDSSSYPS